MIEVKKLTNFTLEEEISFGLNGFVTNEVFDILKVVNDDEISISLKRRKLDEPMTRQWPHLETDIVMYNEIIKHGLSFGIYDQNKLLGAIIAEKRDWNNSIWIAEIVITEDQRKKGLGSMLIDSLVQLAGEEKVRMIGLETQSNNLPAISFYRKKGFEFSGLDLSLYTNDDVDNNEIAIYMKKKIEI